MRLALAERSALYRILSQLHQAAVPPQASLEALDRSFRSVACRIFNTRLREAYEAGKPLSDAMLRCEGIGIPRYHAAVIRAAEESGAIHQALLQLSVQDEVRDSQRKALLARAWYPLLLFHFAVIGPSLAFFLSDPWRALAFALAIIIPADLVLFLLYRTIAAPLPGDSKLRVLGRLPFISSTLDDRQAANYLGTLSLLYDAGVPILDGAEKALDAISDDSRRAHYRSVVLANRDSPFAEIVTRLPIRRVELVGTLITGETAGDLGNSLRRCATVLAEDATAGEGRLMRNASVTLYALAGLYVILRVVGFYLEYLGQLSSIR